MNLYKRARFHTRYLEHRVTRHSVALGEKKVGRERAEGTASVGSGGASEKTWIRHRRLLSMAGTGPSFGKLPRFAIYLGLPSVCLLASLAPRGLAPSLARRYLRLSEDEN